MPDVTVSIVNWNTADELRECLDSILVQTGVDIEIYVVDNASSDGSMNMLQAEYSDRVNLISNSINIGFGRAHNRSIELAMGRYVAILNPDSRFTEVDSISKIVSFLDANPKIGILGPKILNSDGTLQYSARRFPSILAGMFRNTILEKIFPSNKFAAAYLMSDWTHDEISDVDWVSGAALFARKDLIAQIGAFDERFFMYCEDIDWCKRAHDTGWRVVYYPIVTLIHQIGAASDKDPYNAVKRHHKSMLQYYVKHSRRNASILLTPLVAVGLLLRAAMTMLKIKQPRQKEPQNE